MAALYDFAPGGQIASATLSFDSPLVRVGAVEVAGTEASLVAPDPNTFLGHVRIAPRRAGPRPLPVTGVEGGRGIGVLDMARALRTGSQHRATGRLGLHVLDAMFATAASIEDGAFVAVRGPASSRPPPMPPDFDPTARTL